MSDLSYAPPPFRNEHGLWVIFVDFLHANYRIEFDVKARSAKAVSEITFQATSAGHAAILINQPITSARLNGKKVHLVCEHLHDKTGHFHILSRPVTPGIHVIIVESKIQRKQGRNNEKPTKWWSAPPSLECMFSMSDRAPKGGFLERYLPSNYNFDHFDITFDITITNTSEPHRIFSNGKDTAYPENHWKIQFPSFFTSSCPWFHLVPENKYHVHEGSYSSIDHRAVPIIIYAKHNNRSTRLLSDCVSKTHKLLPVLENDFGPFPHDSVTIFARGRGKGGMEYAGATATWLKSLRHELDHSYFATSVIPCDGNAGWMDEAIAKWGDKGYGSSPQRPRKTNDANLGAQSEYVRTLNDDSYTIGREFMEHLDFLLRKRGGLKKFLRVYATVKRHQSINAVEFQSMVECFYGGSAKKIKQLFDDYVN